MNTDKDHLALPLAEAPCGDTGGTETRDLKLMRFAAKAAAIPEPWSHDKLAAFQYSATYWNPLDEDGDAFRLATALAIDIRFGADDVGAIYNAPWRCVEQPGKDRNAATRRAILRAAAEVGRLTA